MDIKKTLAEFRSLIDPEISCFLDKAIEDTLDKDRIVAEAIAKVKKNILANGKRLRPAIMYYSYLAVGGKEKKKILETCVSIELIHAFLLIHDDIMDRDAKRHGLDTINESYRKIGKRLFSRKIDPVHFGNSIAIIIGDMLAALGNQVLFNSAFKPDLIIKALCKLQDIIALTVVGQSKDVFMGYSQKAREKEVLEMYKYKTAKYTIEGPAHLGGILGGATQEALDGFSRLAIPLGIAFQIQDDILGIFGTEKKIGKAVGADIREGKQTLLVVRAFEKGNRKQRKILRNVLGKTDLNNKDIKDFQDIITETGSLDYAKKMASNLIRQGKDEIEKLGIKKEAKDFFLGLADFMMSREV